MTAARRIRVDVELGDAGRVRLDLTDPSDDQIAGVTELLRRWLDGDDYDEPGGEREPEADIKPNLPDQLPHVPHLAAGCTINPAQGGTLSVLPEPVEETPTAEAPSWTCDECGAAFARPQGLGAHRRYKHGPPVTPRASDPELGERPLDDGGPADGADDAGNADLEPGNGGEVDDQDHAGVLEADDPALPAGAGERVDHGGDVADVVELDDRVGAGDERVDVHVDTVPLATDSGNGPELCRCGHALRMHERDDIADQGRGQCFRLSCGCAEFRAAAG